MPVSEKKYEEQGLVRVEVDMDFKTYAILLALVEKSGYKLGKKSRQKSEGIRGVLAQGILELYQKYVGEDMTDEDQHNGLDKINQQVYIFARHVKAMKVNEIPDEKIISTLQSKLPVYLKDSKKGKLLAKGTMNKFAVASTFPNPALPKLSLDIRYELKKMKILKFFKLPHKAR